MDALRESDETEEISDAQIAEELFYDPDANDDDLGMFLGPSDKDLKELYRGGSSGPIFKGKGAQGFGGLQRKSGGPAIEAIGLRDTATERSMDKIRRKSSAAPGVDGGMGRRKSSAVAGGGVVTSDSSLKEGVELRESKQSNETSSGMIQENRKSKVDGDEMSGMVTDS